MVYLWGISSCSILVSPKVEEDGSARHKKKCPPSPVWETQMLIVELPEDVGWWGEGWCGGKDLLYIVVYCILTITSEAKPEGLEENVIHLETRNVIVSVGLLKRVCFFGGSGLMWKTRRMVGRSRFVTNYVWPYVFSSVHGVEKVGKFAMVSLIWGALPYIWVFPKIWEKPQIIHFNRIFHHKPSILGYHFFWNHPFEFSYSTSERDLTAIGVLDWFFPCVTYGKLWNESAFFVLADCCCLFWLFKSHDCLTVQEQPSETSVKSLLKKAPLLFWGDLEIL